MPGCIHNIFFCQDLPFAEVGEALRRDGRIVVVESIASVLNPFIVTAKPIPSNHNEAEVSILNPVLRIRIRFILDFRISFNETDLDPTPAL